MIKKMNLYRNLVPEIIRTQIRNPQYVFSDLIFLFRYIYSKINHKRNTTVYPKSVCYIISSTKISGGNYAICEQLNRLQKSGYKCLIASLDNNTKISWFPNQSIKIIPFHGNTKIIENYNTVIATSWDTAKKLLLLNIIHKMYLIQAIETTFYPKGSYLRTMVNRTFNYPFSFICISIWLQEYLKNNFNTNSFYIPNGLNTEIFYKDKPLEPKPKNKKRVLLEGAINLPFKGMEEAFKVVQDIDCEVWCVSYDGKPKPEWHCDRFFEKVPQSQMRRIYSSCDILLKLSTIEGFGYPPLEMMACGGVSVVSKIKGHQEYIIDKYNGLFTNPKDIIQTKKMLKQLMNDSKLYNKLKSKSKETVDKYNWDTSVRLLEKVISSSDFINKSIS